MLQDGSRLNLNEETFTKSKTRSQLDATFYLLLNSLKPLVY